MRWNELTASDFAQGVKQCEGVCLLPLGVLEKHGDHLPLGMDYMKAWDYANQAAELEPAMVFPPFYFGFVNAATFEPGTFAIGGRLVLDVLEATCREIARNGLKKIVMVNAHGGNIVLFESFVRMQLESRRDFMVYLCDLNFGPETIAAKKKLHEETKGVSGHGGAYETAVGLHFYPHLAKMERILPPEAGADDPRLVNVLGHHLATPVDWIAKHKVHLAGYGGNSTAQYGEEICAAVSRDLTDIIRRVKQDSLSPELLRAYYDKSGK
jgi:creatinine amidohydrolase